MERIENRMAWTANMYCSKCGAHEYDIVEQLEPVVEENWYLKCPQCGFEGPTAPERALAIVGWKNL